MAEAVLTRVLLDLGPMASVLDVGCGRGRIAALLERILPKTKYSGVDIGRAQVDATLNLRPDGEVYQARIQDFSPRRQWDLVIASEVLMHIPPDDIGAVCDKLHRLARKYIVTVDWTVPMDGEIAPWNWLYDYPALFGGVEQTIPVGLQSVFVIRA